MSERASRRVATAGSTMVMVKRDMGNARNATLKWRGESAANAVRSLLPVLHGERVGVRGCLERRSIETPPSPARAARGRPLPASGPQAGRGKTETLVRDCDPAIIDQVIDRFLHVDIGLDDTGLLQCEACR